MHHFRAFLLTVWFAHCTPISLNINVYITEALLCWLRSVTVKCDLEKYLHGSWEYCMNLVRHSHSGIGLTIFILNCSMGYFFCSISTWNYFPLFLYSILCIWLYYEHWFRFDPEIGTGCLLRNLLLLFPRRSQSHSTLLFQLFFKIFIFTGFKYINLTFYLIS